MKSENVQIYPARTRIIPNVKLAKVISNLSSKGYDRVLKGKEYAIIEKRNHRKHGDVITTYRISNAEGYDNSDPLTEFDNAVLSVCISEFAEGNRHTTPAVILRGLTGKTRESSNGAVNKNQRDAIMTSIMKLMGTIIHVDLSDTNKKLNYNDGEQQELTSAILPCKFVTTTVNGQIVNDVICFFDESPLMKIADSRNQILRFETALLDIPNHQNTPMNITVKNYIIRRVLEIKQHHMPPIITFDDIFTKCRIADASRDTKMNARSTTEIFFENLRKNDFIKSYEIVKKTHKFYSVNFAY